MDYDEFGFMNEQLAAMLRDGLPLEGALRQLCRTMHRGRLRSELQALEADLATGTPLREALERRRLPEFYRRMVTVGAAGHDLPGILTLLADYYQQANSMWNRLKGIMVYPLIVLLASLALSAWLAFVITTTLTLPGAGSSPPTSPEAVRNLSGIFRMSDIISRPAPPPGRPTPTKAAPPTTAPGRAATPVVRPAVPQPPPRTHPLAELVGSWLQTWVALWAPPVALAFLAIGLVTALALAPCRRWARWHLPVFRDASLSQLASALALMIRSGCHLSDALALLGQLEQRTPIGRELARWQERCAAGCGRFAEMATESRLVPPLFRWLVASAGEDLAGGLARAAEVYERRALYRREVVMNAALPISLLFLGFMILGQVYPFTAMVFNIFRSLGEIMR
jgi:type II secretory pathway component PulF